MVLGWWVVMGWWGGCWGWCGVVVGWWVVMGWWGLVGWLLGVVWSGGGLVCGEGVGGGRVSRDQLMGLFDHRCHE